ncbi:hypothetical protein PISMIDRAFT_240144 [Pisolithus microcarpus 441]|uniref:Uncharacterized protein n=1 Tax=Pisolithus microcarpus 441 TaxID=765257 RepID=A0A0C9ZAJ7_9AGAM|nr:hypothetical protein PISMIDRAFT_240144 [Pisolithus microcarpus 441]
MSCIRSYITALPGGRDMKPVVSSTIRLVGMRYCVQLGMVRVCGFPCPRTLPFHSLPFLVRVQAPSPVLSCADAYRARQMQVQILAPNKSATILSRVHRLYSSCDIRSRAFEEDCFT